MAEPSNRGVNFPEQHQHKQPESTLGTVKEKAQDLASSAASSAQQAWDSTKQQAQQAWDSTKNRVQDMTSNVGDTFEEAFDSVQGFVRRYPLACIAGGFLVDFLAASALVNMPNFGRATYYSRYEP